MALRQRKKKASSSMSQNSSRSNRKTRETTTEEQDRQAAHAAASSSRRTWMLAAAVMVVVAVGTIVGVTQTRNSSSSSTTEDTTGAPSVSSTTNTHEPTTSTTTTSSSPAATSAPSPTVEDSDSQSAVPTSIPLAETYTRIGSFELLETVPHDPAAFTQGLVFVDADLYESTGLYGQSQLRRVNLATGTVTASYSLADSHFGEGLAHYYDNATGACRLIQFTWREQAGYVYPCLKPDETSFTLLRSFTYATTTTEGWGMTTDHTRQVLYVSDGSDVLHVWDLRREAFPEIRTVRVTLQQAGMARPQAVMRLNELEWDPAQPDTVLANVWFQNVLVRIDVWTGFVTTIYDLQLLYPVNQRPSSADVLNGIALVPASPSNEEDTTAAAASDQVWVTGKLWPSLFRIRLVEPKEPPVRRPIV